MKRIHCPVCYEFMDCLRKACSEHCEEIVNKRNNEFLEQMRFLKEVQIEKSNERKKRRLETELNRRKKRLEKKRKRTERAQRLNEKVKQQAKKIRAIKQKKKTNGFYESKEWQQLRYLVLRHYGRKCMLCAAENCELHVDHIKPRSKFPHLELDFDNLQILCRACNLGKSNIDETDWRMSS